MPSSILQVVTIGYTYDPLSRSVPTGGNQLTNGNAEEIQMTGLKNFRTYLILITTSLLVLLLLFLGKDYIRQNSSKSGNSIALGFGHSCFIYQERQVYCWGSNLELQLGVKEYVGGSLLPLAGPAIKNDEVTAIAAGRSHTCILITKELAIDNDAVQCWGSNQAGAVGIPIRTELEYTNLIYAPQEVLHAPLIVGIAANGNHTCAIKRTLQTDEILCWGSNEFGEIGNGITGGGRPGLNFSVDSPALVKNIDGRVVSLALGENFSCAIVEKSSRTLFCWGNNWWGQLGTGTHTTRTASADSNVPVKATVITGQPKQVAAGTAHACVITKTDTVQCWGDNQFGELGIGTIGKVDNGTLYELTPQAVVGLNGKALSVKSEEDQTCALVKDSITTTGLYCWGNYLSKDEDTMMSAHPVPLRMISAVDGSIVDYAVGGTHVCVVMKGNSIKCWGSNLVGQLGNGTRNSSAEPVEVKNLP